MKKILKLITCLAIFLTIGLMLVGCQANEEMKIYYYGNKKTIGSNHEQQYEYILVEIPYVPDATQDILLFPEDFHIIIDDEKIKGQSFITEVGNHSTIIGDNVYFETEISFHYDRKIKKENGGSVNVYFGCSLEDVDKIFYKNNELPIYV